jgi:hypothetical protein
LDKIWARLQQSRRAWIFEPVVASMSDSIGDEKITCAAPFGESSVCPPFFPFRFKLTLPYVVSGNQMVYGTDTGVYFADLRQERPYEKMISVASVTQVDVLEEYGILVVLAGLKFSYNKNAFPFLF